MSRIGLVGALAAGLVVGAISGGSVISMDTAGVFALIGLNGLGACAVSVGNPEENGSVSLRLMAASLTTIFLLGVAIGAAAKISFYV